MFGLVLSFILEALRKLCMFRGCYNMLYIISLSSNISCHFDVLCVKNCVLIIAGKYIRNTLSSSNYSIAWDLIDLTVHFSVTSIDIFLALGKRPSSPPSL